MVTIDRDLARLGLTRCRVLPSDADTDTAP
jgi:hypothetical protein